MSTPARRRLMRDFKRLQEDPPAGVSGAPSENNIMVWNRGGGIDLNIDSIDANTGIGNRSIQL